MILTPLIFAALQQSPSPIGISMPLRARPEFQKAVADIEAKLTQGDFTTAEKLRILLPKPEFTMSWDEQSIPPELRADFAEERDFVIASWEHVKGVKITVVPTNGDLAIRFGKSLPIDSAGMPLESTLDFGDAPRLTANISLVRGKPAQPIIGQEAFMAVAQAIGAYLGLADDALDNNCMYRSNLPGLRAFGPDRTDMILAAKNLQISDQVRKDIADKKPETLNTPRLEISKTVAAIGEVKEGLKVPLDFTIKNTGTSTLSYRLVPDCGCFTFPPPGLIEPGHETTVRTIVNTAQYTGKTDKLLVLYTNDPVNPVQSIPVTFNAVPPYRLFRPDGDSVLLPTPNNKVDIFMSVPSDSKVVPQQFQWSGLAAKVSMEKWSGLAQDPDIDDNPKPKSGYVFHVKLTGDQPTGRLTGTLSVTTNDEVTPQSSYNLSFQKGILAFPSEVPFSEISNLTRNTIEISRPQKEFKIVGMESGSKFLKAVPTPLGPSKYRVELFIDGANAPKGDFQSYIKFKTSDVSQPSVMVTVRATIL